MRKHPLSIVVCVIVHNDHILFLKRVNDPYKNHWSLPGGKIKHGEHIREAAFREAREETGLTPYFKRHLGIVSEQFIENDAIADHFLIHVVYFESDTADVVESHEGELQWFPLNKIGEINQLIASDKVMIENMLPNEELQHFECVMEKHGDEHILRLFE